MYDEDLSFWQALAAQHPGALLELGCGSGRVLSCLAGTGAQVYGLDHQREPLALLRAGWRLSQQPRVFVADMRAYRLEAHFTLIYVPCNTFSTLDAAQRAATLACALRHLAPGGAFVASLPNPVALRQVSRMGASEVEDVFSHPGDGAPVQVSSAWERDRQRFRLTWHFDHLLPDGSVERLSAHTAHWLVAAETYQSELATAGFAALTTWGDYAFSSFADDSPQLLLYGRKPAR